MSAHAYEFLGNPPITAQSSSTWTSCGKCGQFYPSGGCHTCPTHFPFVPWPNPYALYPVPQGWQCPVCHAVMAPGMPNCTHCKPNP